MTAHNLKMYQLVSRTTNWRDSPEIIVSVVSDKWTFDKGREIEFLAFGLPETFAFIVDGLRNEDEGQRAGDCRAGSWSGLAVKIGMNRYQGTQGSGLSNEASGLLAFGTANSIPFGKLSNAQVSGFAMGTNIDTALGQGYAANVNSGVVAERISVPEYGDPLYLPSTIRTLSFGSAMEQSTKTIRSGPSMVRRAMYEFDGAFASTQFYPRTDTATAIGGVTYASARTAEYLTSAPRYLVDSAIPIQEGGVSEKRAGDGRVGVWHMYFLAGGTNTTPYQVHYLLLDVQPDGSFTFANSTGFTPNSTTGLDAATEAFTTFTDDKANTANTSANQEILKQMYYATKMRNNSFVIKRPMLVPQRFNVFVNSTTTGKLITYSWVISADFINHEYTIGE